MVAYNPDMFHLLLLATQQIPPIHVTVQQPAGAWPEWLKILTAAFAGAVFALCVEPAKRYLARRHLRQTVAKQVHAEFINNIKAFEVITMSTSQGTAFASRSDKAKAYFIGSLTYDRIQHDRYDHYFASQKELMYEIDGKMMLHTFYNNMTKNLPRALEQREHPDVTAFLATSFSMASEYIRTKKLRHVPDEQVQAILMEFMSMSATSGSTADGAETGGPTESDRP